MTINPDLLDHSSNGLPLILEPCGGHCGASCLLLCYWTGTKTGAGAFTTGGLSSDGGTAFVFDVMRHFLEFSSCVTSQTLKWIA